jgi:hypothetical protein
MLVDELTGSRGEVAPIESQKSIRISSDEFL